MFSGKLIDYQDVILKNVGFWLDLSFKEFQVQCIILVDVDVGIVVQVLIIVVGEVNSDLVSVEVKYYVNGYSYVVEVLGVSIDVENLLCV